MSAEPSYAAVASHEPAPNGDNAVIDGPEPLQRPDFASAGPDGLRRRRSNRLSGKTNGSGSAAPSSNKEEGGGGPASSLGLNIDLPVPNGEADEMDADDQEVDGKKSKGKGKAAGGVFKGSRIEAGMSNARKRVAEGLKSPALLGGMKLDEIGEKISKGVEVK